MDALEVSGAEEETKLDDSYEIGDFTCASPWERFVWF